MSSLRAASAGASAGAQLFEDFKNHGVLQNVFSYLDSTDRLNLASSSIAMWEITGGQIPYFAPSSVLHWWRRLPGKFLECDECETNPAVIKCRNLDRGPTYDSEENCKADYEAVYCLSCVPKHLFCNVCFSFQCETCTDYWENLHETDPDRCGAWEVGVDRELETCNSCQKYVCSYQQAFDSLEYMQDTFWLKCFVKCEHCSEVQCNTCHSKSDSKNDWFTCSDQDDSGEIHSVCPKCKDKRRKNCFRCEADLGDDFCDQCASPRCQACQDDEWDY